MGFMKKNQSPSQGRILEAPEAIGTENTFKMKEYRKSMNLQNEGIGKPQSNKMTNSMEKTALQHMIGYEQHDLSSRHAKDSKSMIHTQSKHTDHSKTNKTIECVRADAKLRQEIDDMDGYNNSEDEEENIEHIGDITENFEMMEEFDSNKNRKLNLVNSMGNIDEEEEIKEEMKQFQEAYAHQQEEGRKL